MSSRHVTFVVGPSLQGQVLTPIGAAVPEPAALSLLGVALAELWASAQARRPASR